MLAGVLAWWRGCRVHRVQCRVHWDGGSAGVAGPAHVGGGGGGGGGGAHLQAPPGLDVRV